HTDSATYVADIPAGWRHESDASEATLELFMLSGEIALDNLRQGSGGIVNLPQGCGGGEISSEKGGLALIFWNPDLPSFSPPYTKKSIRTLWGMEWQPSLGEGVHGELHKSL